MSGIVAWELLWRLSSPKLLLESLLVCVLFQGKISFLSRQGRQDPLLSTYILTAWHTSVPSDDSNLSLYRTLPNTGL